MSPKDHADDAEEPLPEEESSEEPSGFEEDLGADFAAPDEPERSPDEAPLPAGIPEDPFETAKLIAERDEYLDALRRLQAEFENFRKRTMRQQTDLLERAAESLLERLLPVLDTLDLALAHAASDPEDDGDVGALAQVGAMLRSTLAKEGLQRIDVVDVPFDPTVHDAVARTPAEEGEDEGVVAEVLRAGYELKGRVLRPAMVKVRG